jgi:hypothetical protein
MVAMVTWLDRFVGGSGQSPIRQQRPEAAFGSYNWSWYNSHHSKLLQRLELYSRTVGNRVLVDWR